jgi:hypothetical protein
LCLAIVMLTGIAVRLSDLPLDLIAYHQLGRLVHERGGEREVRSLFREADHLLPVLADGCPRFFP